MASSIKNGATPSEALTLIDQDVERLIPEQGIPGLALVITDRDGLLANRNYGFADLGALTPVDEETLFEFGSIGKSFTAICLLQLAEAGVVDLDAPVSDYLPWFAVRSQHAPITIHHLLTHTAGIIGGSDFPVDARFEVWAPREADAAPPGERYRNSNVGYKVLGLLLEAVTGKPYAEIAQERILDPLGMTRSAGVITHDPRRRLAVGYVPFYDDRPWRPAHGLAPATWLETNTGDGSLAATAADLAIYLRMLLNGGVGPNGRVLSPENVARMRAPHAEISPGFAYGYGLVAYEEHGRQSIDHGGDWYAADHYEGTRDFATPAEWAAYAGHYRSWNPWVSNFRVVARKGDLLLVSPNGQEQTLHLQVQADGDGFRIGDDPDSPQHVTFDTIVEGEALQARQAGGADYYRFFTP